MENRKNTPRTETGARRKEFNPTFISRGSRDELCSTASSLAHQLDAVSSLFEQSKLTETAPTPVPASENVKSQTPHYGAPVTRSQFEKMFHIVETQARQIKVLTNKVEMLIGEVSEIKESMTSVNDQFSEVDAEQCEMKAQIQAIDHKLPATGPQLQAAPSLQTPVIPAIAMGPQPQSAPSPQSPVIPAALTPAPGPDHQAQAQLDHEEISRFQTNCRRQEDLYYTRSIEIRGISDYWIEKMRDDPTRPPRYWAARCLTVDQTEHIVYTCRKVKFFLAEGKPASLRLTFDSMSQARSALTRLAGCRNGLREQASDFRLEYFQMVPPRFKAQRTALYNVLKSQKAIGTVKNFSWIVVGDRLCSVIRARGQGTRTQFVTRLVTISPDSDTGYDDFIKTQNFATSSELPDRHGQYDYV